MRGLGTPYFETLGTLYSLFDGVMASRVYPSKYSSSGVSEANEVEKNV